MDLPALLAKNFMGSFEMLKNHLSDLSDEELLVRPVPAANHVNWQLGHVAVVETKACGLLGLKVDAPADFAGKYSKDASAGDDASKFLKKDELLAILTATNAALSQWIGSTPAGDLSKPSPAPFDQWAPTYADLASAFPNHVMMHIGQIQVLRRKLGKKVLF